VVFNACIRKEERFNVNSSFHLRKQEKQKQVNFTVNRRKEIIKIIVYIGETDNRKLIFKINQTKSWFF
jgi:hypothetical protein